MIKKIFSVAMLLSALVMSGAVLACGGEESGKHIGNVTGVDAGGKTFTIRDMESADAITFTANDEIIAAVQRNGGTVMVNYEENDEGGLEAVGVTF